MVSRALQVFKSPIPVFLDRERFFREGKLAWERGTFVQKFLACAVLSGIPALAGISFLLLVFFSGYMLAKGFLIFLGSFSLGIPYSQAPETTRTLTALAGSHVLSVLAWGLSGGPMLLPGLLRAIFRCLQVPLAIFLVCLGISCLPLIGFSLEEQRITWSWMPPVAVALLWAAGIDWLILGNFGNFRDILRNANRKYRKRW